MRPALRTSHKGTCLAALYLVLSCGGFAQSPVTKTLGTVKSISGNTIILTPDIGSEVSITIEASARILRTLPGQTDLKSATPISASDIQVGDRVLARGQTGNNSALLASSIIVMSKGDITQKQQQERDEWRKGVGGIVKSVDSATSTITLANSLLASGKPIALHLTPQTQILRYAPDSVKFDESKPGTLDQIKAGDQLRARGTKSADGAEFTAQAIVSGSFREIAGTVISTDAGTNSISLTDLATKKPVIIKVGPETQFHKLPPMMAQMIAFRLKGGAPGEQGAAGQGPPQGASGGTPGNGGAGNWAGRGQGNWSGQRSGQNSGGGGPGGAGTGGNGGWRNGGGGPPDFQQMLSRMPTVTIADLNKGDAVMLVATEGSASGQPIAITMLAGVEPILSAAPPGTNAVMLLSPWNLGAIAGAGGDMSTQ
jgi:hypothetical protein